MGIQLGAATLANYEVASRKEWLLTNGLGGYAMGTASGANLRRYHGHLVASVKPPTGRIVLLGNIECTLQGNGPPIDLSTHQYVGAVFPEGYRRLARFWTGDSGTGSQSAVWEWKVGAYSLRKTLQMAQGSNAVRVSYTNTCDKPVLVVLRPLVSHKRHHGNFRFDSSYPSDLRFEKSHTEINHAGVQLKLVHSGARRMPVAGWYYRFEHLRELERGLDPVDDLFCPCELSYELAAGESAILVAGEGANLDSSFEPLSNDYPTASDLRRSLELAARPFLIESSGRSSIVAGYPWFGEWGRDTMISIPGLCLKTGRYATARQILRDYLSAMDAGLIPNRFVEGTGGAEYNTCDATLWCVHAAVKTLEAEWDQEFAEFCFEKVAEIYEWHVRGTKFGILVDSSDGLLFAGQSGVQLTWMDAKVGDWVITPRHGKPIEIAGLWINALHGMAWLAGRLEKDGRRFEESASLASSNFESKYWHPNLGHYLDTADPDDASLRPNQVIAMSLPHVVCDPNHARLALQKVATELLTENGLRTLGPDEPGYRGRFRGSLPDLDAAYHQGTVWPWLLGPYCTAWVKYFGDRAEAKRILKQARHWLVDCGLGGISEVYDGDKPRHAGGCPFQAWNVAEILRSLDEDAS